MKNEAVEKYKEQMGKIINTLRDDLEDINAFGEYLDVVVDGVKQRSANGIASNYIRQEDVDSIVELAGAIQDKVINNWNVRKAKLDGLSDALMLFNELNAEG